jgi:hypothetical protein
MSWLFSITENTIKIYTMKNMKKNKLAGQKRRRLDSAEIACAD